MKSDLGEGRTTPLSRALGREREERKPWRRSRGAARLARDLAISHCPRLSPPPG
uniref:Uncharacterized protein n=1 Tax=Arundo donax TaxID=35708 RepID=A0A0A9MCY2_ARUDO